jgi:KUP system potassium uptake protein
MEATLVQGQAPPKAQAASAAAALGALGIVYGTIGSSPLYALRETIKAAAAGAPPQREAVLVSVSLIFWSPSL